jgi:8-oxo-dGTP pyrophosphatase MutT (NUDIX family)
MIYQKDLKLNNTKQKYILENTRNMNENNNDFIYLNQDEISNYNIGENNNKSTNNISPNKTKYKNIYCVNCSEKGHVVKECHGPITSFGIIAFKINESEKDELYDKNNRLQEILSEMNVVDKKTYPRLKFLMIQRKDTMGFTDFVRGKYPVNEDELNTMLPIFLNEMTEKEKLNLLTKTFDEIWNDLWINHDSKCFKNEYDFAYNRYKQLDIPELIKKSSQSFKFQEFGFPKGRRNMKETNIACAEREFYEETGYNKNSYDFIKNYPTIYEEFIGTNGVKYRHIYYLVKMKDNINPPRIDYKNKIQTGEVQNIGWFSYEECMSIIRPYDIDKKRVIKKVHDDLCEMKNNFICSNFYYTGKKSSKSKSPKKSLRQFN